MRVRWLENDGRGDEGGRLKGAGFAHNTMNGLVSYPAQAIRTTCMARVQGMAPLAMAKPHLRNRIIAVCPGHSDVRAAAANLASCRGAQAQGQVHQTFTPKDVAVFYYAYHAQQKASEAEADCTAPALHTISSHHELPALLVLKPPLFLHSEVGPYIFHPSLQKAHLGSKK